MLADVAAVYYRLVYSKGACDILSLTKQGKWIRILEPRVAKLVLQN